MGNQIIFNIPLEDLKVFIKPIRVFGSLSVFINAPASLEGAQRNHISFCSGQGAEALSMISQTQAGLVLCRDDVPDLQFSEFSCAVFTVPNPRLAFMHCLQKYFNPGKRIGVHSTAIIDAGVQLPDDIYIGPMAHICSGVRLGEGTCIEDRVYIGPGNVIGKKVTIQVGAIIGCEGQGFERVGAGEFEKFPQLGTVFIEDDVEIGANTTIVRGSLSATRIGQGAKIGHQVNIGHNVVIGRHVFISAASVVCGSARIGDYAWLAPKCCIRNKITIGKHVTVGLGAVVVKDVDDGLTVMGVPAKVTTSG